MNNTNQRGYLIKAPISHHRIITAISIRIKPGKVAVCVYVDIRIEKTPNRRIIIPRVKVIKLRLFIAEVTAVSEAVISNSS